MTTVKTAIAQFTDPKTVCDKMQDILRTIDPSYPQEEERFLAACAVLKSELSALTSPCVEDYLAALERKYASDIFYATWQGFWLNRSIFENPVNTLFLREDYEDLVQERKMSHLPEAKKTLEVIHAFTRSVPKEKLVLLDGVSDFYSYLQTVGYKVAHYLGFQFADEFLPYVLPGYTPDRVKTENYKMCLWRDLCLDIKHLSETSFQ